VSRTVKYAKLKYY